MAENLDDVFNDVEVAPYKPGVSWSDYLASLDIEDTTTHEIGAPMKI